MIGVAPKAETEMLENEIGVSQNRMPYISHLMTNPSLQLQRDPNQKQERKMAAAG